MPTKPTALVTGAAKGIGRGIALALAKAGYNVAVSDIDETALNAVAQEVSALGAAALALKCDVSKKADVDAAFNQIKSEWGELNVLVNNAGIYPFVPFEKMTEADWDKVITVNLKSQFLCTQAALGLMPAGGRIIAISSIAALVGFAGLTHYCATKGGVSAFVRALALETASKKITVNAVAPGAIETPGASQSLSDEAMKSTIAAIPAARMGQPEDIAAAVVFLASPQAAYITGQTITVDGGWTLR